MEISKFATQRYADWPPHLSPCKNRPYNIAIPLLQ